jgi:hypothetical protein
MDAAKSSRLDLDRIALFFGQDLGRQEVHRPDEIRHLPAVGATIERFGVGQLRDLALEHHGDPVRHDQRLFLIMRHQNEGDAHLPLQPDQFHLHLLAHLLVQRAQGSSSSSTLGFRISARASATRCRCPPDSACAARLP